MAEGDAVEGWDSREMVVQDSANGVRSVTTTYRDAEGRVLRQDCTVGVLGVAAASDVSQPS